jgi:hypothetical protein
VAKPQLPRGACVCSESCAATHPMWLFFRVGGCEAADPQKRASVASVLALAERERVQSGKKSAERQERAHYANCLARERFWRV